MNGSAPLTPKEFADTALGGKRTVRWVQDQCAEFVRTKGRRGIAVVTRSRPYLIPASECERFRVPLVFQRAVKVA